MVFKCIKIDLTIYKSIKYDKIKLFYSFILNYICQHKPINTAVFKAWHTLLFLQQTN